MSKICATLVTLLILAGCFGRMPLPAGQSVAQPVEVSPYGSIEDLVVWVMWGSAAAFIVGCLMMWKAPRIGVQVIAASVTAMVGARVMLFMTGNMWLVIACTVLCGIIAGVFVYRFDLEKLLGFNFAGNKELGS